MSAHRGKFPEFERFTAAEITEIIDKSRLSTFDRKIALCCLVWDMTYADAGAEVEMDRSTIGKRMRTVIVPKLKRLIY